MVVAVAQPIHLALRELVARVATPTPLPVALAVRVVWAVHLPMLLQDLVVQAVVAVVQRSTPEVPVATAGSTAVVAVVAVKPRAVVAVQPDTFLSSGRKAGMT